MELVLDRLLAIDPAGRFPSAEEAADSLEFLLSPSLRPSGRSGKDRGEKARGAAVTTPPEPDLPPLNPSMLEAGLRSPAQLAREPLALNRPSAMASSASVPVVDELDVHRRELEAEGTETGRDVHRQYFAELSQLKREERDKLKEGQEAESVSARDRWLEKLGEVLSEPTGEQILIAILAIILILVVAVVAALS
jgi:hypothetical protein